MLLKRIHPWSLVLLWAFAPLACSDNDEDPRPAPTRFVTATPLNTWPASQLQLLVQFTGRDIDPALFRHDTEVFRMVYKTHYGDEEIHASGLLILPEATEALPMASFHRGTIVEHEDAPSVQASNDEEVILYAALASMGFITVVPDMIGFGESSDRLHPYYVEAPTAAAVVDMLVAASEFASQRNVGFNEDVFLAGYSQGGHITMAAHKALEENPIKGFHVVASFPAAGGYDLPNMQQHFFTVDTYSDPHYIAYVAMSYATWYNDDSIIETLFAPTYAAVIPDLFDGVTSKGQIDAALTENMLDLINPDVRENPDDPALQSFMDKLNANTLTDWAPKARMYMYHGNADKAVPYSNSVSTYEKLIANGASTDNLEFITLEGHDHSSGIEPYVEDVVKKLEELRDP